MNISPIWNVVFIAAFSHGFFVALILLVQYSKNRRVSQLYLSGFVASFSYVLVNNTLYWNNLFIKFHYFLFWGTSIRYLLPPFFLLYAFTFLKKRISWLYLLHILPFLFLLMINFPYSTMSGLEKMALFEDPLLSSGQYVFVQKISHLSFQFYPLYLLLYAGYIFIILRNYIVHASGGIDRNKIKQINWLRFLNFLFLLYGLLILLYHILVALDIGGVYKDYPISLVMCIAVYSISFIGVLNPDLLAGERYIEAISRMKYSRVRLKNDRLKEIMNELEEIMKKERLYLEPDITLNKLAKKTNLPKHHISQALSLEKGETFSEFVNFYRIKNARVLLNNFSKGDSIKTIMYDSGFNNRASFNNNFKKYLGMTASEYVKKTKENGLI